MAVVTKSHKSIKHKKTAKHAKTDETAQMAKMDNNYNIDTFW